MKQAVEKLLQGALAAGATLLVGACDLRTSAVLDPKGPIALAERDLLRDAFQVVKRLRDMLRRHFNLADLPERLRRVTGDLLSPRD